MASGRFETKCVGPLETVSLACNSSTVATVTLTATALSTDQNACLSISMSDVPTCPEFTSCIGNIGTGQLGTLACTIGPQINCNNTYGGYTNMHFDRVSGIDCCCGGPYLRHYSSANSVYSGTCGRVCFFGGRCAFNIPPAIESYCFCTNAVSCCCSRQKGLVAIYLPNEAEGGQCDWILGKMCCFQRFGGSLTDDCYYQLVGAGTCCTCLALACDCGACQAAQTPYGSWFRMYTGGGACDIAIDFWANQKTIWHVSSYDQICSSFQRQLDGNHTSGCFPWAAGHNLGSAACSICSPYQCCLNASLTTSGGMCTWLYGGTPGACLGKKCWGLPCASLFGFYPLIMAGCNLQIYQHAYTGVGVQFKSSLSSSGQMPRCSATWWCGFSGDMGSNPYDNNCCIGLRITPGGSICAQLQPDRPHNFVRWVTYNLTDASNYFLWYHECTPVMNGIYSMNDSQLYCIYQHMATYNTEPCNLGTSQCSDAVINTKFATKLSCVPAIWCAYKKAWCMLNTNVFASGAREFSMFASPTDWGATSTGLCFCRFVSTNLVDWSLADTSGCVYKQELPQSTSVTTCYIDFNPSTCNFETNCSNFAALPTGNTAVLEHFTSTGKLERSGIVMGATDRFYVKNTSNTISASVTVWGFNE